jgi:hypothetical protein
VIEVTSPPPPTRKRAVQLCVVAIATALTCGALLIAAAIAPAPIFLLPVIVVICIGLPMFAAWELPRAAAGFRHHRQRVMDNARAMAELRAGLAELPETRHPLGF